VDAVQGELSQRLVGVKGEGSVAGTGDRYLREIMGDKAIWTRDHSGTSGVGGRFGGGIDGVIQHILVGVMVGAVIELTVPVMYGGV